MDEAARLKELDAESELPVMFGKGSTARDRLHGGVVPESVLLGPSRIFRFEGQVAIHRRIC